MRVWGIWCACALLLAAPAFASGITSFEPDTTVEGFGRRVREPMVDTPIWVGSSYSLSSRYERSWRGFSNTPGRFGGLGLSATWPWKSKRQGWLEWSYRERTLFEKSTAYSVGPGGTLTPFQYDNQISFDMFTLRTGVEQRIGKRGTPLCTAGVGLGYGFGFSADTYGSFAHELIGRVACFSYPTRNARLGLMLSGGPAWTDRSDARFILSDGSNDRTPLRTYYEVALRLERRVRFPQSVAD